MVQSYEKSVTLHLEKSIIYIKKLKTMFPKTMRRFFFIQMLLSMMAIGVYAQKTVYIPNEWRNPWPSDSLLYQESDPDNQYTWSKSRSVESENVIVFWDKGYGSTLPSKSPKSYQVDEQDLLKKCVMILIIQKTRTMTNLYFENEEVCVNIITEKILMIN